jgi:hypothetical protein
LKSCYHKNLLPMLYFHTDERVTKELFLYVYHQLQDQELLDYPFHYIIKRKKQEFYETYVESRKGYSAGIKIKSKDAPSEKTSRLEEFDLSEKQMFISKVCDYYGCCEDKLKKQNHPHLKTQLKNLQKEHTLFLKNPDFRYQDIFQKHPSYCFTEGDPMSGDEIRQIRKQIKELTGTTLDYEDPLLQLLKRGIGLYVNSLPDVYNWTVQRLLSQKKLGIVISDRTLCLGIDLPIRSVSFTGYKDPSYTTSDYLQMSGRAGRRGKDKQGNILFHGIPEDIYLPLMKGDLPSIVGSPKPMYESYNVLRNHGFTLSNLYQSRIHEGTEPLSSREFHYPDSRFFKLLWYFRYYEKGVSFVENISSLERRLFRVSEGDRVSTLWGYLSDNLYELSEEVIHSYQQHKIEESYDSLVVLEHLRHLGYICRHLVNTLNPVTFMITLGLCREIFAKVQVLRFKYSLL